MPSHKQDAVHIKTDAPQIFHDAEEVIREAMVFSDIDPKSAPVRFAAAERAAAYAVYVALGITGDSSLMSTAHNQAKSQDWQQRLNLVDEIVLHERDYWAAQKTDTDA